MGNDVWNPPPPTLVVGVSTRALFDLEEANKIWLEHKQPKYREYHMERENIPMEPGTGFPLVKALLGWNEYLGKDAIRVVVISSNAPELAVRVFRSAEHHGINISAAAFTAGKPEYPYFKPFGIDLLLSANQQNVDKAAECGLAAGLIYPKPDIVRPEHEGIRIALDGDAVIFSDESERVFLEKGLPGYEAHERANLGRPIPPGPFSKVLRVIAAAKEALPNEKKDLITTALVTSRSGIGVERATLSLRCHGLHVDQSFFMGSNPKAPVLEAFGADIFFDDSARHTDPASKKVPTARVPTTGNH